jgi:hypothetical protein
MPMDRLGYHPLADLFPLMSDEEVNDLGEDMLIHGQRKRIMLFEGMILARPIREGAVFWSD